MAENSAQILVLAAGDVYLAPTATAAPTNATTALNAAFVKYGYIDDSGPSFTPGLETSVITGWQSPYPLRTLVTARTLELAFNLLQMTEDAIKLAMGGGTWSGSSGARAFDPPAASDIDQRSVVIEGLDGAKVVRLYVPIAQVSSVGSITFTKSGASSVPITMSSIVTSSSQKIAQFFRSDTDGALT